MSDFIPRVTYTEVEHIDTHYTSDPQSYGPADMEMIIMVKVHFTEGSSSDSLRKGAKQAIHRHFKTAPANRDK
jgi:hypothetical protein